jgi:hypothetical protein
MRFWDAELKSSPHYRNPFIQLEIKFACHPLFAKTHGVENLSKFHERFPQGIWLRITRHHEIIISAIVAKKDSTLKFIMFI